MALIADFQQFYGLQLEDLWTGDIAPARVLVRIQGLHTEPYSRFRSAWYTDHPPKLGDGAPPWLGFTQEAGLLTALLNFTMQKAAGKKKLNPRDLVKTPADQKPKTKVFRTIAEFADNFRRR